MLPRFHDSSFIYNIWHSAFGNYVASITCFLFHLRYLNSASRILELCCLDSMFLFLFTVCAFWIMELCCLDFMILSFIYDICIYSAFRNYVASILCCFFHLRYLNSAFPILELCCRDSMIIDYLRTVFGIQRIYYTVIMLPRFHRVRTRWPGNNLWARLKREKLEPISRIIWKKSPSKWV